MTHFAIAGIQMPITMQNNLDAMQSRLDVLMFLYPWVEMVVFSELAVHGPVHASAQPTGGEFETAFQQMALRHGIWLIPGSLYEKRDDRVYNTTPVINPAGEIVTRYRKMFPFTPYEVATTPGDEVCVFDVPNVGRFGVSICYDLWFPELTRSMVAMGAEVIINPVLANFIDRPADLAIVQASAAMFQSYIVSVNGLGVGGNGYSMVVDPSGQLIHKANVGEELIPVELDLGLVRRQRSRGLRNMGQPLKSFRDRPTDFAVYREGFDTGYLDSLGPLEKPGRANPSAGNLVQLPGATAAE
ncbi:carbon-nitrogen hydrolase family protein [Phaeovulum sp.]|uniref:carbon-nitrogen hydrolase family protein n=1 Tax=Phaeovulum sp. TaxID=2934796 RepID=UPI0039E31009